MNCGARSSSGPRRAAASTAYNRAGRTCRWGFAGRAPAHFRPAVPENDDSTDIRMKKCYSKSLKSHKERVRRQFLSLRQDASGRHSLRSLIGPLKPRNCAVFEARLLTSASRSVLENLLCVIFQWLITTYFLTEMWGTMDSPRYPQTRRAASNVVFDPDLEQGGNINVVVRRDPATGDMTRVLVHRWCRPARGRPRTGWPMLEPYPTPGSNPSHNRAARVTGAKLLRAVVWHRQRFCQRPA